MYLHTHMVINHKIQLFLYVCLSNFIICFDASTKAWILNGEVCIASNKLGIAIIAISEDDNLRMMFLVARKGIPK